MDQLIHLANMDVHSAEMGKQAGHGSPAPQLIYSTDSVNRLAVPGLDNTTGQMPWCIASRLDRELGYDLVR